MSIGVVIANRNYGHLLSRAIASALNQTVKPDNVVVVDGESTDDSTRVMSLFDVSLISIPPGPIGQARNKGIEKMGSDFFVPLDSDDWLEPTFLEETAKLMQPGVGAVGCGLIYQPGGTVQWPDEPVTAERLATANRFFNTSLVRTAAWSDAGRYEDKTRDMYEDWDLWYRMAYGDWQFRVARAPLFNYSVHADSSCARVGVRNASFIQNFRRKNGL